MRVITMTDQTKKSNIIFMSGKEKIIQKIFSSDSTNAGFGYLAVGYNSSADNGFINEDPSESGSSNGFIEISRNDSSTYQRVPVSYHSILNRDSDNGKITAKFTAELDIDNIIEDIPINQIAIVDNSEANSASTTYFAASVTETFTKNEKLALVFVIEITM